MAVCVVAPVVIEDAMIDSEDAASVTEEVMIWISNLHEVRLRQLLVLFFLCSVLVLE